MMRSLLVLLFVAMLPASLSAWWHLRKSDWGIVQIKQDEVRVEDVLKWSMAPIWVDARSDAEYVSGHITGAISLNEDHWNDLIPELLSHWSPNTPLVVYCSASCDASRKVAERLKSMGLAPVHILYGGWEAWRDAKK